MRSFLPSIVGGAVLAAANASATNPTRSARGFGGDSKAEMVAASWYAGWNVDSLGVDAVAWDKYTHVTYAFGCALSVYSSQIRTE